METDDSEAHAGTKSFKLMASDATGSPTGATVYYKSVPIEADKTYTIAFWAKAAKARYVRVYVKSTNYTQTFHYADIYLNDTDWKEYAISFTSEEITVAEVRIGLGISETKTTFWVDDFRFFEAMPDDEFVPGDVSGTEGVTAYDAALTLQFAVGLATPTDAERLAADMNGDGNIGADDAILILRIAAGLTAPGVDPILDNGGMITIALAEAYGVARESVTVPLTVDDISSVAGGDICIIYDDTMLRVVDISFGPEMMLVSNATEPGILRMSFVGVEELKSETLARIQFDMLADDALTLRIRSADLYNPEALPLISGNIDRRIIPQAIPPERSALLQNFPNPFNPDTWIPYHLREDSEVVIRIFDMKGELVREFDLGLKSAGLHVNRDRAVHWDGTNNAGETVASGVYFYSISAGDFAAVKKLTVLR